MHPVIEFGPAQDALVLLHPADGGAVQGVALAAGRGELLCKLFDLLDLPAAQRWVDLDRQYSLRSASLQAVASYGEWTSK